MNKIEEIFKSWNIAFKPNSEQSELASKRIEICNSCEHKVVNLGINRCSVCGCALKGKVFTPVKGACPKGKWDEVDNEEFNLKPVDTSGSIFVQIASYRDPELRNTISSLLENADDPNRLTICIAWQHNEKDDWDQLEDYFEDPRFKIIDIDYKISNGTCWARNQIQQFYNGEDFTLQLDSHHRFIKGWDTECIRQLKNLQLRGYKKPILTTYLPSYNPSTYPEDRVEVPWKMNFDKFIPEGAVFFLPAYIDNFREIYKPIPARFYSGHFAFTVGEFVKEVKHDPSFYFHGEEITIAVRAFTHGYDLFHPHTLIAWHEYTRSNRVKQWDDDPNWTTRNAFTHSRVRKLLGIDGEKCTPEEIESFGEYYLGTERTLKEYEEYAGLNFKERKVHQYTIRHLPPPTPTTEEWAPDKVINFTNSIRFSKTLLRDVQYKFWAVILESSTGIVLYRRDILKQEIEKYRNIPENLINIKIEYQGPPPSKWIIWPYSEENGWENKIEKTL